MPRLAVGFVAIVFAIVAAGVWWLRASGDDNPDRVVPGEREHLLVEVLNGTRVDGLARTVTRRLRREGIDVVFFGTVPDTGLDITQILIRRGDSTAALRVAKVLGIGRLVNEPNERLLLDASVILGLDAAGLRGLDP